MFAVIWQFRSFAMAKAHENSLRFASFTRQRSEMQNVLPKRLRPARWSKRRLPGKMRIGDESLQQQDEVARSSMFQKSRLKSATWPWRVTAAVSNSAKSA